MANSKIKSDRQKAISSRIQVYNPSTGHYIKMDPSTGKFVKSDGKPFTGIRIKKSTIKANPNVRISVARKAENAVIKVKNSK